MVMRERQNTREIVGKKNKKKTRKKGEHIEKCQVANPVTHRFHFTNLYKICFIHDKTCLFRVLQYTTCFIDLKLVNTKL